MRDSVRRREDGKKATSKSTGWSERVESSWWSGGGPADLQKTKGHEHVCHAGMPVRNGNIGTDRTTTTKVASVRKQLGTKIARVTRADLQGKNGGVKGRDRSAEELDRETGEEQLDYCGKDTLNGWRMTGYWRERQSWVNWAGEDEGGQGWDGRPVLREMWGRQERRKTGRRRQETGDGGKDYQMRRWWSCGQHLTPDKGKKEEEREQRFFVDSISTICFAAGDGAQRCRGNWSKTGPQPNMGLYRYLIPPI